ncbi:MAG: protein translocase subunit SecF [Nitrosomonadales bacterium]|nr:protein translocase subunit SecF [Nitrosomonadales bacterium]
MELFRIKHDIPFLSYGKITPSISLVTFILAIFFLVARGLNFGVDFTGGTVIEMHYSQPADVNKVREQLGSIGLHDALVQNFGSSKDVLIQVPLKQNTSGAKLSEQVHEKLRQQDASVEMRRVEFVGPQVGKELVENGSLALLLVSLGIVCYLWLRFEWKFGLAAIIANLHDVVIILGFFAFFQWEFSLSVLAAVLAVLGYSVNESVVVFDRIRENFRKMRKTGVAEIIDNAITRTMSRTIITHGCTQMMVTAMLFLGGETLHYFALALTIGILFSIYSSVLVASPLLMMFGVSREDFIKPEKTEAEEALP